MKSNKQRRLEIKAKRRKRVERLKNETLNRFYRPLLSIEVNPEALTHNSYYYELPLFYVDKPFKCKSCGSIEVWTAKNQKWWYEVMKGHIESTAVYCRTCRKERRKEKQLQKAHMAEMAKQAPHPNDAFFKKRY